jgi:threonine synthase
LKIARCTPLLDSRLRGNDVAWNVCGQGGTRPSRPRDIDRWVSALLYCGQERWARLATASFQHGASSTRRPPYLRSGAACCASVGRITSEKGGASPAPTVRRGSQKGARCSSVMAEFVIECSYCGSRFASEQDSSCANCGGPGVILVDLASVGKDRAQEILSGDPRDLWQYADFLPLRDRKHIVSLGEGGTRLIASPRLGRRLGIENHFVKNETTNPTGSFKDRQVAVGISRAVEIGADTVAVVSSGNVAAAAAAYAARAGLRCYVFVPEHAPEEKLVQVKMCGASARRMSTRSATEIFDEVIALCRENGWYHLSTAGIYNPFNVEGAKTIAYELFAQCSGSLPDWIVCPVGGGGLLGAVWRGFRDLVKLGLIHAIPRLVGVQAAGCAPLVRAIENGETPKQAVANRWDDPETVAGGIADDILFDAHTAIPAVRETRGRAVAVSDEEILEAERLIAVTEGIFCEPSGSVSVAGLKRLVEQGEVKATERVCCLLTGAGVKDIASAQRILSQDDNS